MVGPRVDFLGLPLFSVDQGQFFSLLDRALAEKTGKRLFFLNAHCFNISCRRFRYRRSLMSAEFLLSDGIGVELGCRLLGLYPPPNLNGTDLIPKLLERLSLRGMTLYVVGASQVRISLAVSQMRRKHASLRIVGSSHGYFPAEKSEEIFGSINDSGAEIVLVGMGVPRQELWIEDAKSACPNVRLFVGGGAILDFYSEEIPRAPRLVRRARLEWLFRLANEPGRLWSRYLVGNIEFFLRVILLGLVRKLRELGTLSRH